jgi:hypothetical protein
VGKLPVFCALGPQTTAFLKHALQRLQLSARAHHRILRIARTIADLEASETIDTCHLAEAIQYRNGAENNPGRPGVPRKRNFGIFKCLINKCLTFANLTLRGNPGLPYAKHVLCLRNPATFPFSHKRRTL